MLQPSMSSSPRQSPLQDLRFGFPRIYLVSQLRARLERLLGDDSCQIGYLDAQGTFVAVDADAAFDGPAFALSLRASDRHAALRDHVLALQVSILHGVYRLRVLDLEVDIAFMPALDEARLMTTARRIVHTLEGVARVR